MLPQRTLLLLGFGLWVLGFAALAVPKALDRHFHADEFQVAYNSALWGVHALPTHTNYTLPYLLPLTWLAGAFDTTSEMLLSMRLVFACIFGLNLLVCAWAQPYFTSRAGRLAVLVSATLFYPLWLNGFEIRHDVLIASGVVLLYGLAQRAALLSHSGIGLAAGFVCATMQMNSIKAMLYWPPLGGVVLLLSTWKNRNGTWRHRVRPTVAFLGGLALGVAFNSSLLWIQGSLELFTIQMLSFGANVGSVRGFSPTPELVRLSLNAPVIFGAAAIAAAVAIARLYSDLPTLRSLITLVFLSWTLLSLYLNPTPFPYNFLYPLPFVFFMALDGAARVRLLDARTRILAGVAAGSVLLFVFVHAWKTDPFLLRTNAMQLAYIRAAELLTSPQDSVLDGCGLVLSRKPPHPDWMLHSSLRRFYGNERATFASIMLDQTNPVLLSNYRWSWLTREDLRVRKKRYVQLAPHLWVLGQRLTSARALFAVYKSGKYYFTGEGARDLLINGQPISPEGTRELSTGLHRYETGGSRDLLFHWLGPNLAPNQFWSYLPQHPPEPFFTNEPSTLNF